MSELSVRVSDATIRKVADRAERLASVVESATENAEDRKIREAGAHLIDLLNEWLEDIKELRAADDHDVEDKIQSFWARLHLAEKKVLAWDLTPALRRKLEGKTERTTTRRRKRKKKKAASAA